MGSVLDNLDFTQKWAVVDLILKKNKNKLPDRTIQYSNPKRPATYCRNVGKRRRWEFAIQDNENEKEILSDKYIWNFLKPWLITKRSLFRKKSNLYFSISYCKKMEKGKNFYRW